MKKYMVFDTGEICTEDEVKESFEQQQYEILDDDDNIKYESFEAYMEDMLSLGRQRIGGMIEIEED